MASKRLSKQPARPGSGPWVTVFRGTSLDGFIARADGQLDFLDVGGASNEDHGFADLIARTDALVMGRNTFDVARAFKPWPYAPLPVVVLTHRPLRLTSGFKGRVEPMSGRPATVVHRLAERGWRRLYVDGGKTTQSFLRAGLVDELVVTRVPVLIGQGVPLFGRVARDIPLTHVRTRALAGGLVQSTYRVARTPAGPP